MSRLNILTTPCRCLADSFGVQDSPHREHESLPAGIFTLQSTATRAGQRVDPRPSVILRRRHLRFDISAQLEAMERRVEGPLARVQRVVRDLPNAAGDAPPVIGTER